MENKYGINTESTIAYYDENADEFISTTVNADVSELYKRFESLIVPGCRILDLGCGSGRDSKYFYKKGYLVTAMDASIKMCECTKKMVSVPVLQMKAEDINYLNEFDGIWACASLLHVSRLNIQLTIEKIINSLKSGGVLYASWKYGEGEWISNGRSFTDYTEGDIRKLFNSIANGKLIEIWLTDDVRDCIETKWINILAKKAN